MNFSTIKTGLTNAGMAAVRTLEHHAPTILTVGGVCGAIGAAVMACRATMKLPEVNEICQQEILDVKGLAEDGIMEQGSPEHNKAMAQTYIRVCGRYAKLYAPSAMVGAASLASILASKKIMDNRYAGALNAVSLTEQLFSKYRERVVEELGAEKDIQFRHGIREQIIEEPVLDKNGDPKVDKKTGEVKTAKRVVRTMDEMNPGDLSRIFDEVSTRNWDRDPEYNLTQLLLKQSHFNQLLQTRRFVTMNEIYEALGFPLTGYGQDFGYVIDEETPNAVVDFGLYDINPATNLRRMDEMDIQQNAVLLTFKGARYIKDKIYKVQRIW